MSECPFWPGCGAEHDRGCMDCPASDNGDYEPDREPAPEGDDLYGDTGGSALAELDEP